MEEARQHSAVTTELVAFAIVYFGGLLAFAVSLLLQFAVGGRSLHIGLLVFIASRIVVSFWRAARPEIVRREKPSPLIWTLTGFVWLAFGIAISLPFWEY